VAAAGGGMIAVADHPAGLIATLAVSLSAALVLGYLARRVGISPIVGYMVAGWAVGPHTPGFVADTGLAGQLAEIGIALLMFGVGLHFSLKDLLSVRAIAFTGALGQCALATGAAFLLARLLGWSASAGLVFGLALSVASTVVMLRGLTEQGTLHTVHGRVAIGWLIVQDILTVLLLLLLPALASADDAGVLGALGTQAVKLVGLVLLYPIAVRAVPWCLVQVSRLQSRELFTLTVLVLALGVAFGSAELFGISMALGAFLGGMVVGQSDLSHQAAADALPFRDAFAVLFFVSVGMLVEPGFVLENPGLTLSALAVVLVVNPLAGLGITLAMKYPMRTGLTVAAGLAQIGEFSLIVAAQGTQLQLLPPEAYQVIVITVLGSIALNPFIFRAIAPLENRLRRVPALSRWMADRHGALSQAGAGVQRGHVILCGYGRVGSVLGRLVRARGWPLIVIEQDRAIVQRLRTEGVNAIQGDSANALTLERAAPAMARILLITLPDPLAARQIVAEARKANPALEIVARVHAQAEREHLQKQGGVEAVLGEVELAVEMARLTLRRFGVSSIEAQAVALDLRRGETREGQRAGAQVLEVTLTKDSPSVAKRLAEAGFGRGVIVMAIDRAGELLVPHGDTVLQAGDQLLIVTGPEHTKEVRDLL
jgi:CPA2 family monovalent cation:H+ antiporter-2